MTTPTRTREKEIKSFPAFITKAQGDDGIVEAIVSVLGNIDHGMDIIHPGAFTKTIHERGGKIKVLDGHNMWSAMDAIAKIITIKEVGRDELPPELLNEVPDAQGGLLVKAQFMMDDSISSGIFKRIKAGVIDEYSIGFEIIQSDITPIDDGNGNEIQIRNIREIKLWEISPVVFGMNDATTTVSAKSLSFVIADMPQPNLKNGSAESCKGCAFYGRVADTIGFCKSYDTGTEPNLCCDDYESLAPTFADDVSEKADTFMVDLLDSYNEVLPGDDIERLKSLSGAMSDAIVALFPKDILAHTIPEQEIPLADDIEQENIIKERKRKALLLKHEIAMRGQI